MSIKDTVIQTAGNQQPDSAIREISCDALGCPNKVVFDRRYQQQAQDAKENAWMKEIRTVQSADGRVIIYCSDACEVKGVATGKHNLPTPKVIVEGNAAAIAQAAQAAAAAANAEAAIRSGQPANIQIAE